MLEPGDLLEFERKRTARLTRLKRRLELSYWTWNLLIPLLFCAIVSFLAGWWLA